MQDGVQIVFTTFKQSITKKGIHQRTNKLLFHLKDFYLTISQKESPTKLKHKHDMSIGRITNTVNI